MKRNIENSSIPTNSNLIIFYAHKDFFLLSIKWQGLLPDSICKKWFSEKKPNYAQDERNRPHFVCINYLGMWVTREIFFCVYNNIINHMEYVYSLTKNWKAVFEMSLKFISVNTISANNCIDSSSDWLWYSLFLSLYSWAL